MKTLLVIITSDVRRNPVGAEMVRIAAGVGAWQKIRITVYLHGPAILALDEFAEEHPDGLLFSEYLPALARHEGDIWVEAASPYLRQVTSLNKFEELSIGELAQRASSFDLALRV